MLGAERILALDIGASTVKVAEFQPAKTQGLRLMNFNYADLGIDPEHDENRIPLIVSSVRNALREKGMKGSSVMFTVSGQQVFTRFVKLPPVDESKVSQIIQYEAQQNVPFPIEEVIWDYQLIGKNAQGELEVVLVAIKSDLIEELNEAIESVGLRTEVVDVAPMALHNAVRYNYGDLEGCTVVLDVGARTTNLLFLEKSKLFCRSIPIAGNAITQGIAAELGVPFLEAEKLKKQLGFVALGGPYEEPADENQSRISKTIRTVMTRLHAEVARSINFYRGQQGGSPPARLLLSGGSSIIPYTDRFFQEKINVPIEYFNPLINVEVDAKVSREELGRCAHFLGEVIGLGLRRVTECPIEVNLLPKSIRRRAQVGQKRPYFIGAAICVLLMPVCWLAYTQKVLKLKELEMAEVSSQVDSMQQTNKQLTEEKARLDELHGQSAQLEALVRQRSVWIDVLQDINSRLVPNVWLMSFDPQVSGTAAPPPAEPRASRDVRAAPPPPPPSSGAKFVNEVIIKGEGHRGRFGEELQVTDKLATNLRESPLFGKDGVDVTEYPNPMLGGPTFTFTMRLRLLSAVRM